MWSCEHKRSEQSSPHAANPMQSSQCRCISYLTAYLPQYNLSWHSMHTYLIYSTASLIAENVFLYRITERIDRGGEYELCEKSCIVYPLLIGLVLYVSGLKTKCVAFGSILLTLTLGYLSKRHRTTIRKVAGSIPDAVIWIFHWFNLSGRTMALGSIRPLTEMSSRNVSKGLKAAGDDSLK
jgi:hypothetical protein